MIELDKDHLRKTNLDRVREMDAEEIGAFIKSIADVVKNIYPLLSEIATALVPLVKLIAEYPELLEAYQKQAALNEPVVGINNALQMLLRGLQPIK